MDLWSVIPTGVHQYTILSTMVSSIPLENNLEMKSLDKLMHARFLFHHSNLQLAYTTQAWNLNLKLVPCKQTYEMHIQMHQSSLWACSPLLVCSNFNFNWSLSFVISLPLCHLTLSLCNFSPFVINDHKCLILDRLRLSMSINGVRIIFPNLV